MTRKLDPNLIDKIAVKRPYFALEGLEKKDEWISAFAPIEYPMLGEAGQLSSAEAGRHLAILGSLAIAHHKAESGDDGKYYYLATNAFMKRTQKIIRFSDDLISVRAKTVKVDKRQAYVLAEIENDAQETALQLHVEYKILKEPMFERLFSNAKIERTQEAAFPTTIEIPSLKNLLMGTNFATAQLGPIEQGWCEGHFDGYPMLPVANIMKTLSEISGELFLSCHPDAQNYRISMGSISAERLALLGETLSVRSEVKETKSGSKTRINTEATNAQGQSVAKLEIEYFLPKKPHL